MKRLIPLPLVATLMAILAVAFAGGCRTSSNLEPAESARTIGGSNDTAVSNVAGVQIVTETPDWPGNLDITTEVTPVRVVISNQSDRPLFVRYSAFALVSPEGARFTALPPYNISGTIEQPVTVETYPPIVNLGFVHEGFVLAPYFSLVYPGIDVYEGTFPYDPYYYDTYYTMWREVDLPTEDMRTQALPEGVLESGGRVNGWLYFQPVDPDIDRVNFRVDLIDAETGNVFGEIRIPYDIE